MKQGPSRIFYEVTLPLERVKGREQFEFGVAQVIVAPSGEQADGECFEIKIPGKRVVCDRCDGRGVHDHPAFSNGITASEMDEHGDDFREDYMRGVYDVACESCKGERVVLEPDLENLTLYVRDEEIIKAFWEDVEQERRDSWTHRHEMAMGY